MFHRTVLALIAPALVGAASVTVASAAGGVGGLGVGAATPPVSAATTRKGAAIVTSLCIAS